MEYYGFDTFSKGISLIVIVIARVEFELAYCNFEDHHFRKYATKWQLSSEFRSNKVPLLAVFTKANFIRGSYDKFPDFFCTGI